MRAAGRAEQHLVRPQAAADRQYDYKDMAKHRGKAQIKHGQTIRKLKQACAKDAVIDQSGGIVDKSA